MTAHRLVGELALPQVGPAGHRLGGHPASRHGAAYLADDSRNNRLVEVLALGEGYHANHHDQPTWVFHGWKRFSFDPSKWVIESLEALGLAWGVRRPDPSLVFKPHQLRSTASRGSDSCR